MCWKVDGSLGRVVRVLREDAAMTVPRSSALSVNVGAGSQLERPISPRSSVPISRPSPSYKPMSDVDARWTCAQVRGETHRKYALETSK